MRFLDLKSVVEMTGLSPATIRRLEKTQAFPERRRLSRRRIGWLEEDIINWIKGGEK